MKVYLVNALESAELISEQKERLTSLNDLFNRYIEYLVLFTTRQVIIEGIWTNDLTSFDSLIIGNTNAKTGRIQLYYNDSVIIDKQFSVSEYITIISLKLKNEQSKVINKFRLQLNGTDLLSIGLLYIGEEWDLPRFIVHPKNKLTLRNDDDRTFSGQSTGIVKTTLKSFSAEYIRINNKLTKILDDYINAVQTVIPHVIDIYPEAHDEFPPFWATIASYGEKQKRAENGFFWNLSIAWQEAK
jgi:hypothetical protein